MNILVDTSVWINHFKNADHHLTNLLYQDSVMTHPMIIGEILCGTPPKRNQLINHLLNLKQAFIPSFSEIRAFVDKNKVYGLGCGFIDLNLLVASLITPNTQLWTADKRLLKLAEKFLVAYTP